MKNLSGSLIVDYTKSVNCLIYDSYYFLTHSNDMGRKGDHKFLTDEVFPISAEVREKGETEVSFELFKYNDFSLNKELSVEEINLMMKEKGYRPGTIGELLHLKEFEFPGLLPEAEKDLFIYAIGSVVELIDVGHIYGILFPKKNKFLYCPTLRWNCTETYDTFINKRVFSLEKVLDLKIRSERSYLLGIKI